MRTASFDMYLATRVAAASVVALALTGSAPALAAGKKKASVKIVNKSDWVLDHLFLSATDEKEWGPDQLGKDRIESGANFTLTDIDCDSYDVKLVDEDGDECVLEDVDLCEDHSEWKITNSELLGCEGFGGR